MTLKERVKKFTLIILLMTENYRCLQVKKCLLIMYVWKRVIVSKNVP